MALFRGVPQWTSNDCGSWGRAGIGRFWRCSSPEGYGSPTPTHIHRSQEAFHRRGRWNKRKSADIHLGPYGSSDTVESLPERNSSISDHGRRDRGLHRRYIWYTDHGYTNHGHIHPCDVGQRKHGSRCVNRGRYPSYLSPVEADLETSPKGALGDSPFPSVFFYVKTTRMEI